MPIRRAGLPKARAPMKEIRLPLILSEMHPSLVQLFGFRQVYFNGLRFAFETFIQLFIYYSRRGQLLVVPLFYYFYCKVMRDDRAAFSCFHTVVSYHTHIHSCCSTVRAALLYIDQFVHVSSQSYHVCYYLINVINIIEQVEARSRLIPMAKQSNNHMTTLLVIL